MVEVMLRSGVCRAFKLGRVGQLGGPNLGMIAFSEMLARHRPVLMYH